MDTVTRIKSERIIMNGRGTMSQESLWGKLQREQKLRKDLESVEKTLQLQEMMSKDDWRTNVD